MRRHGRARRAGSQIVQAFNGGGGPGRGERVRAWRLRLAQLVAPAGADVHDPDQSACPHDEALLEAAQFGQLRRDPDGRFMIDMSDLARDLVDGAWFQAAADGRYELTRAGQEQLARLWGPHLIPPWGGGHYMCYEHGIYEAAPGESGDCPRCPVGR